MRTRGRRGSMDAMSTVLVLWVMRGVRESMEDRMVIIYSAGVIVFRIITHWAINEVG